MENSESYYDDGLTNALLSAANEVETSEIAERESETHNQPSLLGQAQPLQDMMRAMSETFTAQLVTISSQMTALTERVENVEKGPRPITPMSAVPVPVPSTSRTTAALWCDRPLDEPIPNEVITWPDDDPADSEGDEFGCQLNKVSEETEVLLKDAFSKPVSNGTRRRWRKAYGMPACDSTKCPKLDNTVKAQLPKECKDADRPLARLQALLLDAVGPLSALLELHQGGQLTPEKAVEATSQALRFLGNASANISVERRKRVANYLNKDLRTLIEDDSFSNAAPCLFGKDFEKSAKEHIDSVRSLRKMGTTNQGAGPKFFRPSRPYAQASRGGGSFRGGSRGGRGRYRPYWSKENRPKDGNSRQN